MRDTAEQVLPSCHPLDMIHLAKVIVGEFRSAEFLSLLDILLVFVNHFVSQRPLIKIYKSFGSSDLFFIFFTTKNLEDNFCLVFFVTSGHQQGSAGGFGPLTSLTMEHTHERLFFFCGLTKSFPQCKSQPVQVKEGLLVWWHLK